MRRMKDPRARTGIRANCLQLKMKH
jgi:hypothetical protein